MLSVVITNNKVVPEISSYKIGAAVAFSNKNSKKR